MTDKDNHSNGKTPSRDSSLTEAEQWQMHEHIASPIQIQAQKLLDDAGSPGLAKHAIDAAAGTTDDAARENRPQR